MYYFAVIICAIVLLNSEVCHAVNEAVGIIRNSVLLFSNLQPRLYSKCT